jgi:hypothetical protein
MFKKIFTLRLLVMMLILASCTPEGCSFGDIDEEYEELYLDLQEENGGSVGGNNTGTGSGACPVGTWYSTACGDSKGVVWTFRSDKTGSFSNKDCNGVCTPIVFTFKYSISGSTCNIMYDAQQPVVHCTGYQDSSPPKPKDDSFTFSCSGSQLTVTSANGTAVFTK